MAIIVAVIVYGSLYPFTFRQPEGATGPLRTLLESWAETYLPDRSAEITDPLMSLLIGAIIAVVKPPTADLRKRTAEVKRGFDRPRSCTIGAAHLSLATMLR